MQDNYVGDIGDYGKYGLLREVCAERLSLSVNWYRVVPKVIGADRTAWHLQALEQTKGTDVVFLDPDNGLETFNMFQKTMAPKNMLSGRN